MSTTNEVVNPENLARHEGIEAIRQWIVDRNPGLEWIDDDADLIEARWVDSLSFVEFIYLIGEVTGKEIDADSIELDHLRSLDAIRRNYFQ